MIAITQGMATIVSSTSGASTASWIACACSANALAAARPFPSRVRANIGTKPALNAPSANRRRRKLGSLNATKKASASGPAPSRAAIMMSRTKPRRRETSVIEPTVAIERTSPTGRGALRAGSSSAANGCGPLARARRRRAGGPGVRQAGHQLALDLAQLGWLRDLQAEHVLDVEHVDHALAIGADVRAGDHQ